MLLRCVLAVLGLLPLYGGSLSRNSRARGGSDVHRGHLPPWFESHYDGEEAQHVHTAPYFGHVLSGGTSRMMYHDLQKFFFGMRRRQRFLEIGCGRGLTTRLAARHFDTVFVAEGFADSEQYCRECLRNSHAGDNGDCHAGVQFGGLEEAPEDLSDRVVWFPVDLYENSGGWRVIRKNAPYDLIFIDANHGEKWAWSDAINAMEISFGTDSQTSSRNTVVESGNMILFHDYTPSSESHVWKVVDVLIEAEILSCYGMGYCYHCNGTAALPNHPKSETETWEAALCGPTIGLLRGRPDELAGMLAKIRAHFASDHAETRAGERDDAAAELLGFWEEELGRGNRTNGFGDAFWQLLRLEVIPARFSLEYMLMATDAKDQSDSSDARPADSDFRLSPAPTTFLDASGSMHRLPFALTRSKPWLEFLHTRAPAFPGALEMVEEADGSTSVYVHAAAMDHQIVPLEIDDSGSEPNDLHSRAAFAWPLLVRFSGLRRPSLIRRARSFGVGLHYLFRRVRPLQTDPSHTESHTETAEYEEAWYGVRFSQRLESLSIFDLGTGEELAKGVLKAELARGLDRWVHGGNGRRMESVFGDSV